MEGTTNNAKDGNYRKIMEQYWDSFIVIRNMDILEAVIEETLNGMAKAGHDQMTFMTELGSATFKVKSKEDKE